MNRIALATGLLLCASVPAFAADVDRFAMEKTEGGYVRLDRTTGEMSLCREETTGLVCRLATDNRPAVDVDAMTRRIEELEKRVARLEGAPPAAGLPSEEEFEKTLSFMERFFRRFMDIVRTFESETPPQKT